MMFGHQDDKDDKKDHQKKDEPQQGAPVDIAAPEHPADDQQAAHNEQHQGADDGSVPPTNDDQTDTPAPDGQDGPVDDDHAWQHPGEEALGEEHEQPQHEDESAHEEPEHDDKPEPISDIIAPAGSGSAQNPATPMPINARDIHDDDAKTPHELIDIKQKALSELQPLLGQLDQSPEDKFRTLMMIIQASDNQDMVKQAYDVAENIKDEKIRAQALLDIVNEINYFTQHPQD